METSEWDRMLRACEEMASWLDQHSQEGTDPAALREARSLCRRLHSTSPYGNSNAERLERLLEIFFSPRRWAKEQQGAQGVRMQMRSCLNGLRQEAQARQREADH